MPKIKKVNPKDAIVLGIDPSLNGAGFLRMQGNNILDFWFFTDTIKIDKEFPYNANLNRAKGSERLNTIYEFYQAVLHSKHIDYVAIEDYAYGAKSNSIFQIGGLGEMLRLQTYRAGIPYRDYEISKIKKYATGVGNAEKSQMVLEAYKEAGFDVSKYGKSGEDLADAYWIAKMLSDEVIIHKDKNYLKKIPKYRAEVFTETSKAYPIPIINRPFISNRGD